MANRATHEMGDRFNKLFEPIRVGHIELKNRIVMSALYTGFGQNDQMTEQYKSFYAERAKGGASLLCCVVSPIYLGRPNPRGVGIYDDRLIPPLREFTDIIHAYGAKVAAQLSTGLLRARGLGEPPELVGPSDVKISRRSDAPKPRPLTVEEIAQIVEETAEAAHRAREAGFDAVEFHALAGSCLPSQFISPHTNKRTDQYGGSLDNRYRLLLEMIQLSRKRAGDDFTYLCRIAGADFMEGGQPLEETVKAAPILERAGLAALNVTTGWHEAPVPFIQMSVPRGTWVYLAEEVKKAVNIPVIGGTRINDPLLADQILSEGRVDLVYMGRALIADPELPNKARQSRLDEIRPCIACCHCMDVEGPIECAVNARAGRETEYTIEPTTEPRKVFVIGGGPAGMEAARVASMRGHEATLWEKDSRLGGQLNVASIPPYKSEIPNLVSYLCKQIEGMGVDVRLNQEASSKSIEEERPDVIVVAIGASAIIPDIPGIDGENVVTAIDVLTGRKAVGDRVIIIGGGMVGCETAEFLHQKGKRVTILEMLDRMGNDIGRTTRWTIMQRMRQSGIGMETKAEAVEITQDGVRVSRDGDSQFFEGDSVVLAVGFEPNRKLSQELQGKAPMVYAIGDCVQPQRIAQAIEAGFRIGSQV